MLLKSCGKSEDQKLNIAYGKTEPAKPTEVKEQSIDNKSEDLINSLSAKITANANDAESYYERAKVYQALGQYRTAILDYSNAIKLVPDSANAYFNRGLAYQSDFKYDQAIADFTKAIKLKADFAAAYNARGLVYLEQEEYQSAYDDYREAIKIDPSFDQAYFNMGTLYAIQKKYKEAQAEFTKAIEANKPVQDATPQQIAESETRLIQAYVNRANAEYLLGDLQSALKDVDFAIGLKHENIEAFRLRAAIHDKMGDTASAARDNATADDLMMQQIYRNNN